MEYNPSFIEMRQFITEEQLNKIEYLNRLYKLNDLLTVSRNVEELGIDFVHASAQIEGNTYDRFDTVTLLKNGQTAGGKKFSDALMIVNLREAFNYVMFSDYEISKSTLLNTHHLVMKGLIPDNILGNVRNHSVTIGGSPYIPPMGRECLDGGLKRIFEVVNQYEHTVEKAIYLHLNLSYLQYFSNGNRRTSMLLQNAQMVKGGLVPLLFSENESRGYLESIVKYYEYGNAGYYVKWFMDSYKLRMSRMINGGR